MNDYVPRALLDLTHTIRFHPAHKPERIHIPIDDEEFQFDSSFVERWHCYRRCASYAGSGGIVGR